MRLATFEGQEAAILFPTGYAANVGTLSALAEPGDLICSDRLNHASLIDGCRLSRATVCIYDHDRLDKLEAQLSAARDVRRKLIVTDGVFSMDGVLAPLRELCSLAEKYGADVIVDEAHATGVFGPRGRGVCELLEVEDRVALRIGTLSKAIGSIGGFVTGRRQADRLALEPGPDADFSRPPRPPRLVRQPAPHSTSSLRNRAGGKSCCSYRNSCARVIHQGHQTIPGGVGPIVPLLLDDPEMALDEAQDLEKSGFLVGAIRPPSVPAGTSRLRIGVMAAHEAEDIDRCSPHCKKPTSEARHRQAATEVLTKRKPHNGSRQRDSGPTTHGLRGRISVRVAFFRCRRTALSLRRRRLRADPAHGPRQPDLELRLAESDQGPLRHYRVLAVDHIGCGFSDKPQNYNYRLAQHIANLERFVTGLDLREVTLFAHDWGGAIGMGDRRACRIDSRDSSCSIRQPFVRRGSRCESPCAGFRCSGRRPSAA